MGRPTIAPITDQELDDHYARNAGPRVRPLPSKASPAYELVQELHKIEVADRLRFLDWIAEHRTSQLRSALRDYRATGRPLRNR